MLQNGKLALSGFRNAHRYVEYIGKIHLSVHDLYVQLLYMLQIMAYELPVQF